MTSVTAKPKPDMSEFSISVVIPVYDRADLITRALESVLAQTRHVDEIIIVDDGSGDHLPDSLAQYQDKITVLQQNNRGVSAARNYGIQNASGNWIGLLDSDDSWEPKKLEMQIDALEQNSEYLISHTNETWYRNGELLSQKKKHEKKGGYIFQHCLPLCAISPSSVIIRRDVFNEVGLFDETLPACEDYDLWLRICCRYPVLFIDTPLTNKHGGHDDQLSKKHWGMDRFRIQALVKCIDSEPLNKTDREAAINMLLEKVDIFLKGAKKHGNNEDISHYQELKNQYHL
ncbi:MAG: glycosyltransferase family A protein [Pseudomonadota bacterium]